MTKAVFTTSIDQRYFEDYMAGAVYDLGRIEVDETEVLAFGRRFDPQPFHTDPEAAKQSSFGGVIASGWHTASMMMKLFVEHYLSRNASLGSPGVDELRWLKPVFPGDLLTVRVSVMETTRSRSKPDRGILRSYIETLNQRDEVVMTMKALNMIGCRDIP